MLPLIMIESKHSLTKSFGFAFEGIKTAVLKGRNFRIQAIFGIFAIFLGLILKINSLEWISLILTISFVLILELINTAIEAAVDMVSPEINPKAKIAKDVSAAAVLIASVGSIIIGVLIFLPKFF